MDTRHGLSTADQFGPEGLLGGFYSYWSGAVRADFVTANFAEYSFHVSQPNRGNREAGPLQEGGTRSGRLTL